MVFTIYSHGGHLGYVTWTIYSNLALIGLGVSEKMMFEYYGHIAPEQGQTTP